MSFRVLKQPMSPLLPNYRGDYMLIWICDTCMEPFFTEEQWKEYMDKYKTERQNL